MKKLSSWIVLALLATALSSRAVAPPHGDDRWRELVAWPDLSLTYNLGIGFQGGQWVVTKGTDPAVRISELRAALKQNPRDIERLLQLGNLLDENGETNNAKSCYQQAERLCRNKIAARPQDGLVLAELGNALWELDEKSAAGNFYRQSVVVSPNDWRCWVRLGNFLAAEPFAAMIPGKLAAELAPSPQPPPREALNFRPSPEALREAEAARAEASRCFTRAVALAPREPQVFFERAGFIWVSNWQSCFFRHFRNGEEIDASRWNAAFFAPEPCADLWKAAALDDRNYELISLAAYFEWISAMTQAHWPANFSEQRLPGASLQSIHQAMARLDDLSRDADPKAAAGALENLGFLNLILNLKNGDQPAAIADFRRAVALDPTRESSWDLLLASMASSGAAPDEFITVAQSRLSHKSSARNHLILAKSLVLAARWTDATAQAEAAERLETNNIIPPLLIAAIALKQSAHTNYLSVAGASLARASQLLPEIAPADERRKRAREFGLDTIIYYVLNHQPDEARNAARDYLKLFPDSDAAREILRDLGGS